MKMKIKMKMKYKWPSDHMILSLVYPPPLDPPPPAPFFSSALVERVGDSRMRDFLVKFVSKTNIFQENKVSGS